MTDNITDLSFNKDRAKTYIEGPPRQVPGYEGLHKMISFLLQEKVQNDGKVLIVGAGGGLEIKSLADGHKDWSFEDVDPSPDMVDLAKQIIKPYLNRVDLRTGYIDSASMSTFNAATAILVFHFISHDDRIETLKKFVNVLSQAHLLS